MKFVIPTILLATSTLTTVQAVTAIITPVDPAPPSCTPSHPTPFKISVAPLSDSSTSPNAITLAKRAASTCSNPSLLVLTLHDSILTDVKNRTGYIASNYQFQFDDPPQSGALLTAGFSICSNGSLAMEGSTVWYQCKSGDFSNLYNQNWAPQCEGIHLQVIECDGKATMPAEVQAAKTGLPICEIGDGQIQAHTTPYLAPAVTITPTASASGSSSVSVSPTFTPANMTTPDTPMSSQSTSGDITILPSTSISEPSGVTSASSMKSLGMATSVKAGSVTTGTASQSSETMLVSEGERVQVGFWAGVLGVVAMI